MNDLSQKFPWAEKLSPRLLKSPWWIGHIPFAFELIGRLRPRTIVELGTYSGSSFAAFCQAAEACGAGARCYGVDLWEGDIHMGSFDEALFREVSDYMAANHPQTAVLVRKDFNAAVHDFADGSIDLLHIDGTHTYEAVENDFTTWLPKMSARGVVLFHDVNVNEENTGPSARKFGVRRFFDAVKGRYPHFDFDHCWGLGVLVVGPEAPAEVMELVDLAKEPAFRAYFAAKGGIVSKQFADLNLPPPAHGTFSGLGPSDNLGDAKVKLLALYFPQFHAIPENDAWWGKGFTDWDNVRKATPKFSGHYQPRVPQNGNYYDQSKKETLAWQIDLARRHGVHGFCHYHYWFDGKQLLETPTNLVMQSREKEFDFPFCLAWANETWSRRWDGRDHHILQKQSHEPDPALWMRHFEYLFRAWTDDRAVRVDGRPLFLIYRPHLIREIGAMLDLWRAEAVKRGLPGLFLVAMKQYEFPVPDVLRYFDATMQFQPFEALFSPDYPAPKVESRRIFRPVRMLPERMQNVLRAVRYNLFPALTFYDYEMVWKHILQVEREGGIPAFPGAFVDWDNTARYVKRARIFKGASPERFAYWFRRLVEVTATRPDPERIIFMNAWNEWAEGTYLEPDERHGLKYLEAVRDAIAAVNSAPAAAQGLAAD